MSPADPNLERFVRRMPKAELHVHLEGAMRPATLLRLAKRRRVDLPATDEAGLKEWFRFRDFEHFVEIYLTCSRCLRDPEDFQLLADDFLAEQARQNVRWTEGHFTIGTHAQNGANPSEVLDALAETIDAGERRHGVRLRLIFDIVRNVPQQADLTLDWALEGHKRGMVVALGLSGIEAKFGNGSFRDHFATARDKGLHRVAHAGEHAGPEAIRSALEVALAERIGHGVRAVDDPALVESLRASGIPLEVCPSSNVCLGAAPSLRDHPFDRLYRAGVQVSVNSDDPPMFDTTLTDEFLRLHEAFGYPATQLAGLALAAVEQSFLPAPEKEALMDEFRADFEALGGELLGAPVEPEGVPA